MKIMSINNFTTKLLRPFKWTPIIKITMKFTKKFGSKFIN